MHLWQLSSFSHRNILPGIFLYLAFFRTLLFHELGLCYPILIFPFCGLSFLLFSLAKSVQQISNLFHFPICGTVENRSFFFSFYLLLVWQLFFFSDFCSGAQDISPMFFPLPCFLFLSLEDRDRDYVVPILFLKGAGFFSHVY